MRLARWVLVLGVAAASCTPDAGAQAGSPVRPTTPAPTLPAPPPAAVLDEVADAYQRSWTVYARAVAGPDPSVLPRAFAGSALALRRQEVGRLQRAGEAIVVRVTHRPEIILVDDRTAVVTDVLDNHMVRVAADSRLPLEPDPDEVLTRAYTLRRGGGTWKVTEAVALG